MGFSSAALIAPAVDGSGAAVDVSGLGPEKTIVVDGAFTGDLYIEASRTGGAATFVPVARLEPSEALRVLTFMATFVRITRRLVQAGSPVPAIVIGAASLDATNYTSSALDVPAGSGSGAAADLLATFAAGVKSLIVRGAFGGQLFIDGSHDGASWDVAARADAAGVFTIAASVRFLRVRRAFATLGAPTIDVCAAVGNSPQSSAALTFQSGLVGGVPTESEVDVWIMSDRDQNGAQIATLGNDNNDGLSKAKPLLTIEAAHRKYGWIAREGICVNLNLAGWGARAVDEWTDPVLERQYWTRSLHLGGAEAHRNSWRIRGPRRMVRWLTNLAFTATAQVGILARHTFATALGGVNGLRGFFLVIEKADAREVFLPLPIVGNTAGTIDVLSNFPANSWHFYMPGGANAAGNQVHVVYPGAVIVSGAAAQKGVAITGYGASYLGDTGGDVNPAYSIERCTIIHGDMSVASQVSFDACMFLVRFRARVGNVRFSNCSGRGIERFWLMTGTRTNVAGSSFSLANEFNGRALAIGAFPAGDPQNPTYGIDLYIDGPLFVGDWYGGQKGGQLHISKGLAVTTGNNPEDGSVSIVGPESQLFLTNDAKLFLSHAAAAGVGVWAKGGAQARINVADYGAANTRIEIAATNHLKVGRGATIQLGAAAGQFMEVAGYNGNFSRALQTTIAGIAQHDTSRIYDKTWEDGNVGGQDPYYGGG